MSTSATAVRFDDVMMLVEPTDDRTPGVPLTWFPRLHATSGQRMQCRISITGNGLSREQLNEDISVEGLLAGQGDLTAKRPVAI